MEFASKIIDTIFGKTLSGGLALLFLLFVVVCIVFVVWAIYYAVFKGGIKELGNISWLTLKENAKFTTITISAIVVFSSILFAYDFVLDKILNIIVNNAK